jgi:hypothetical protein
MLTAEGYAMTESLTMNDLQMLDEEPRVHDLRLAEALGFSETRYIRKLIKRNTDELQSHGRVCATVSQTSPQGGRPAEEYWLNEPQAILIAMFSRTERAAEVRHLIIEVFMAWRKGRLLPGAGCDQATLPEEPVATLNVKLAMVREARLMFGMQRARTLWATIGLPAVPPAYPTGDKEPYEALAHILDAGNPSTRTLIESAIDEERSTGELEKRGIVLAPTGDDDMFAVICGDPWNREITAGTPFEGRLARMLSRLPGAGHSRVLKHRGRAVRAIWIPLRYLDEEPMAYA